MEENLKKKVQNKEALPLNGNKSISFDTIEIISRKKKLVSVKKINNLGLRLRKKINSDISNIVQKKNFKGLNFTKFSNFNGSHKYDSRQFFRWG